MQHCVKKDKEHWPLQTIKYNKYHIKYIFWVGKDSCENETIVHLKEDQLAQLIFNCKQFVKKQGTK